MPPRLSWRHLIPGLIGLAILALIVVGVLMFAGVGRVRGDVQRIYVLTDQARGVMGGTEVWLDGQKVGDVKHVGFRPPDADTLYRVVIAADIRRKEARQLRDDATFRVRSGGNVIGPVVLSIESGTPGGRPIREGDTVRALVQTDAHRALDRLGDAGEHLAPLMADARTAAATMRDPGGTMGALFTHGLPDDAARLGARVRALQAALARRQGGDVRGLRQAAAGALARVDSVRALLASPRGSIGRFRRDSTLLDRLGEIRANLDSVQREMRQAQGTVWRLKEDSALVRAVAAARDEMALLFADVRRSPWRYIHF